MHYEKNSERSKRRSKRFRIYRRLALIALTVVAAIVIALALRPRTHASPVHRTVVSIRRASAPRWGEASKAELSAALRAALAPAIEGAESWSFAVVAEDGSLLFADHAGTAVTPASVQKLIVSDAALSDLPKKFHFTTLLGTVNPIVDGSLSGDLWVAGAGDPALRSDDLLAGVRSLRAAGLRFIRGRVVVDPSAVAGEEINPLWNADDGNEDFMTATSGLSIDGDTVEFDVEGNAAGTPAAVQIKPRTQRVRFSGTVMSGGGDDVIVAATQAPNEFRLAGNIPPGVREKFWVPVHGIPSYAADVVDSLLKSEGVDVQNAAATGTAPLDVHVLWTHRSPSLPQLLKHMLVFSDNHFAEQLMRTLGGIDGAPPDDRAGLQAERSVLAAQAVPTPGLRLVDGSGLAHANRIAAITLARILSYFDKDPHGNPLYPLLPRGGMDGTLRMYHFGDAAGRVRAKSGHLSNAASLAGYVQTKRHGRVAFAFMINGSPADPDDAIVDAVDRLAER